MPPSSPVRRSFHPLLVLCLLTACALPAAAHDEMHQPGHVPEAILEKPIALHQGLGPDHQKVTTTSPRAQAFYDQGVRYLHSYVWVQAARSFHQALRLDPHLGMADLGLADALIGLQDVPAARHACEDARVLAPYMSPAEKDWLNIRDLEVAFLESGDPAKLNAYKQALDDASAAYPKDPWFLIQRGLAEEASPFTHGQASASRSVPYYKQALAFSPDNLAAFHYVIHAHENLGDIRAALDESATYARLAWAIPHAHHMRGHELMRMGKSEEAIREFDRANQLEEASYRAEGIPAEYDWHHAHNLQLMGMNEELLGRMHRAELLFRQAFALPASTEFLAYNRRAWPEFLLDRGRYQDALTAATEMMRSPWPLARLAGFSLAGEAQLGLNHLDLAQQQLDLAQQEASHIEPRIAAMLPYPAALQAAILLRQGSLDQGNDIFARVEQMSVAMPGPDGWIAAIFVLNSIAREARDTQDWPLAQQAAEQIISHDPYFAGGHFALGLVALHAGEQDGARQMFSNALQLWSTADDDLPEIAIARAAVKPAP